MPVSETSHQTPIEQTGPGTPTGLELPHAAGDLRPNAIDVGSVQDNGVIFENWKGDADRPAPAIRRPLPPAKRVGFAIAGLGRLALEEILPAFLGCEAARPVAVISDRPDKARVIASQYGISEQHCYRYDDMEALRENPDVQAVYVVTPNGKHLEHVRRAAAAGKHVLCEKPMANTSREAQEMIALCATAGVKLMIAYRCQYEPYNLELIRRVRSGELGRVRLIQAVNTQMQGPGGQWRLRAALAGGGALPDIGLYCLNGVCSVLDETPVEVMAHIVNPTGDVRYSEIEETIAFTLTFASGAIAHCAASYGAHESKDMQLFMEKGVIDAKNIFAYHGQGLRISRRDADHEQIASPQLGAKNAFTQEIDHFARCIMDGTEPKTPGAIGLRDHRLMEAIYLSARRGAPVKVDVA